MNSQYFIEQLKQTQNDYELKMFRIQYGETQLKSYLIKKAKKHNLEQLNKIYLVRNSITKTIVAWFGLKAATLPYCGSDSSDKTFLIPAIELTHFAVDERYKNNPISEYDMKTGEFVFWNLILPIVKDVSKRIGCKDLYVFAINETKLMNYYKQRLGFITLDGIDEKAFLEFAKPEYDLGCRFLYKPLN